MRIVCPPPHLRQPAPALSRYGPHNFHTKLTNVWDYVKRFGRWAHYYHKKLAWSEGRFVPFPLNTETLNTIYD